MSEIQRSELDSVQDANKRLTRKLKQLLQKKRTLSSVLEGLLETSLQLDSQLQDVKDLYTGISNQSIGKTEEMVKKLEQLNQRIYTTVAVHGETPDHEAELFPSRVSPEEYFQEEEKFTSSLTNYTRRQFFEGIADMAGSKDNLRYEILEVSKPELFLIKGESDETLQSKCKELKRLQSVYVNSQTINLGSLCKLRRLQACLYKTEDIMSKISSQPSSLDVEALSSDIAHLHKKCEEGKRELRRLFEENLTSLVKEMSEFQTAKVVSGNFDLKIARQDYFISKQDAVIEELLLQNSRYEFLSMLYEMEAKSHRETYHLLSTAKSILNNDRDALGKRLELMQDHVQKKPLRETIDSRDYYMQNLFKLFETNAEELEKRPFITYAMLEDKFNNALARTKDQAFDFNADPETEPLDVVKRQLEDCTSLLFGNEASRGIEDTQQEMFEKISKIDDVLKTIEKSVKSAISEIDGKKKILAADSLKALERTLFTNFFNDPSRLKRIVSELRTRAEAIST
ncbi:HAUS augmin-like complex subunit 3 isoform X1 [Rhopilema esculentum]|uniref:HAUS augmin-like complex subunit 3 isoform X1 n=2 Tax=Rhopilema esculentum TaxID=499914 RepID=UPI0031D33A43